MSLTEPHLCADAPPETAAASGWEQEHHYGERVHILDNPLLSTALARLASPSVGHGEMLEHLRNLYRALCTTACGRELPSADAEAPTRMAAKHPDTGIWRGRALDSSAQVVVCDIIRAGIVPAQVCYELLATLLPPENVRLDHLTMARISDEAGQVTGVDLSGSKIGGTVSGATLLLPDPMGATGATTLRALDHYREHFGEPARVVALPIIATPEYLKAVLDHCEHTVVYTLRVDRGLSPPEVLATVPGTHWKDERGLDETSYIVPGAGGMGEVLNNSWC